MKEESMIRFIFRFSNHWKFLRQFFQSLETFRKPFFQSLETFPTLGKLLATVLLVLCSAVAAWGQSDDALVSNAVNEVRREMEAALSNSVPSLNLFLQTPSNTFFVSSAASPELALTTNTTFRFASNTKNFTATAVLLLQQMGLLNVTNRMVDLMPGASLPYIPEGANWAIPYKEQITIEQLLRHSAGVYDVDNDEVPGCGGESYTTWMIEQDPAHQFTVEDMVAQAALHQLSYFAPGEGYHYSNTGYAMLAEIVGRVYSHHTGEAKTLSDFIYEMHIVGPDIRFPNQATDTALPEPFSPGTERRPSDVTIIVSNCNMSAQVGEGNGYGTLPALNRHIRSTMRGDGVLSSESVRLMQTSTSSANANYGFGCTWWPDIGFGHNGARVGNISFMAYNPDTDVSVAVYLGLIDYSDLMDSFMICFQGMYNAAYRALEALGYPRTPTLARGSYTNLTLSAGATNTFYVSAVDGAYYAFIMSNTTADVRGSIAPAMDPEAAHGFTNSYTWLCDSPGTYRLTLQAEADTPCSLTLTGWKMPEAVYYSDLNWTNAFIAAHETFSRQYAFTDWKSVDWGALYSNTLPRIAAAQAVTNEVEYYAALNAYAGAIPDSHIYFATTNTAVPAAWAQQVAGGGYGLALTELDDGRVIAAALLTNGPAELAGMQAGADIASWNGLAPTSAIAQIDVAAYPLKTLAGKLTLSPQATREHERLEQARLLVRGPVGTNVGVQFVNPGSTVTQTVALTATADTNATFGLLNFAWMQDPSAAPVEYSILSNGLGYVVIRGEDSSEAALSNMTAAVNTFAASNVPGVILDVRGNLGGDDALAAALCGYFYRTNVFYERQKWYNTLDGTFTEFTVDTLRGERWVDHLAIEPQAAYYGGPVAVLVNPGCVSSGEGIAMGIGSLPRAQVVGFHGTDGSFGMAGAMIWLPGGHVISYPFGQSLDANGTVQLDSQNGVGGIAPSMRIPLTASNVLAYAAGEDVVLDAAADYLLGLPELPVGQTVTGTLSAGETQLLRCTVEAPVWHGIYVTPTNGSVAVDAADLSVPGTYSLTLSNASGTAESYSLRLYNLTNTIARVSSLITNLMAENDLVGLGFSMIDGDQVVMAEGFGLADRERGIAADKDTVFMIGSCTKTFGAVAAMQLVDEGLLDLDTSITNALPGFTIHQRFADNIITPRTILAHHSGLPGDLFNLGFSVRPIPGAQEAIQQLISGEYTLMPTNTFWAYNNCGFVLLNGMFTNLTGQALDVFARERLLDRMGMTNSSIAYDLAHIEEALACPYMEGELVPYEYVNLGFAGAIYSTAADMTRYMRMLLNGGMGEVSRVLPAERLASMFVKQNSEVPLDQFNTILNMGIGFLLDPPWMQYMGKIAWHDGATDFYRSMVRVAVDARLGCFISCNTAEAEHVNPDIIDAALKWAYEEKTGIAPPPPVEPGMPALAVAPPEVVALATSGVFVTGAGYDYFTANETGLVAHINAQSGTPATAQLVYRDNGWYTPATTNTPQFLFTQVAERVVYVLKNFAYGVTNLALLGEQSGGLKSVDPAWAGRIGRWWATNLHPDDISWHGDAVIETEITLSLSMRENMLLAQEEYVMVATNDSVAFAAGLGRNKGSALQARPDGALSFLGVHYRSADSIPSLVAGAQTNGVTISNETHWLCIDAPSGQPLTIDLVTEGELVAYLYDTNGSQLGQANRAHAFHLDASNAQPVMAAIVRNGAGTGPWTLATHTNAIPFYHLVAPVDWPATFAANSNLYPNTDFGYVFVRENRAGDADASSVLKIAIARMKSSSPARPLLFLNGGPGDSGIRCAYQYFLKGFIDTHDIVLIDPRGVGYSQPALAFRDDESPDDLQYRLTLLQQADLSALHTVESSYDIEDLANALGIAEADLLGQSYGTLLAQTLMRRAPAWLRAVILDGVVAPNIPGLSHAGPVRNEALENLFADVGAHPQASVWYPQFGLALHTLSTNLQKSPVSLVIDGVTNQMNGLSFLNAVFDQLTSTDLAGRERIPNIVWRASRGETAALAELLTDYRKDTNLFVSSVHDSVQQMLVIKHDFLPFDSLEAASNACIGLPPLVAQTALDFMAEAVEGAALFDDYGQADASFTNPVTVAIPTLVINGTYDTQTGTNWAAEVARHLPSAHFVVPPAVGHGVLFATNGCTLQVMRDFLDDPARTPDTTCFSTLVPDFPPPWPANTDELALGQTVTGTYPMAESASWNQFSAVSGIVYTISQSGEALVRAVDADGATLGSGTDRELAWQSLVDGVQYITVVNPAPGSNTLTLDLPLLLRGLSASNGLYALTWQSLTNTTVDLWATVNLIDTNAASILQTNLTATGWFTTVTTPAPTSQPAFFYYLRENQDSAGL
jgi:CubicO group peptidase (beta-lactamase class C family)/pimeloyl-ACP methyl ester carboxylesterase/C-terminal processing protease CtpA/Prc